MTKVDEVFDVGQAHVEKLNKLAKKHYKTVEAQSKKAAKVAKNLPAQATELYEKSKKDSPSSANLAKVSLWSGLSSLVIGFPANAIALASAATIEDRRRLVNKGALKKVYEKKTAPSAEDVKNSRIGAAAGAFSLIAGLIVLGAVVAKGKKTEAAEAE